MIKFDIKKVKPVDIEGNVINVDVAKTVGNVIFLKATTLGWDMISREIYIGNVVELSQQELEQLKNFLLSDGCPIYLFVKKALSNYFETLKKS